MCKHCWGDDRSVHHKDWIRGWADDGYEETRHRASAKSKTKKKYPGCPGNDRGPHVYVWTTEKNHDSLFFDFYGFHKYEKMVCAGCGNVNKIATTEEYRKRNDKFKERRVRRGERVWKWIAFEDYDEEYREKRRRYISRNGYTNYLYSTLWDLL